MHHSLPETPGLLHLDLDPDVLREPPPARQPTVAELLDAYERDILPTRARTTQYNQRLVFARIRADLGHLVLRDLTPAHLRQWRDSLRARGYKPDTVRRYVHNLSGPLSAAVREYEWLHDNPVSKVRLPARAPGRVRYLSDDERHRLLEACQASPCTALFPVVLLALTTGARKQELLQLRWANVDLQQGTLWLLHTKNHTPRSLPIVGLVLEVVRAWHAAQPAGTVYVFPSRSGCQGRHITTA